MASNSIKKPQQRQRGNYYTKIFRYTLFKRRQSTASAVTCLIKKCIYSVNTEGPYSKRVAHIDIDIDMVLD